MIAEPWDIGPGGYQLGNFPPPWLEWNDRYRDRVRRFWRGDAAHAGRLRHRDRRLVRRVPPPVTRSVNFIAAHDGFTPRRPRRLPPEAQRGQRRGRTATATARTSPGTTASRGRPTTRSSSGERQRDLRALLGTLFASRGTIMLDRRRRVRPHPARQQQRLRPGQRDHLARLGRPRPRARGLCRRPRGAPPRPPGARRPGPPHRRAGPGRHSRRRLADRRRTPRRPPPTGRPPTARPSPCCSAAAATAGSRSSSTAAGTTSPSSCRPAAATAGTARRAAGSRSGRAPSHSSPSGRASPAVEARRAP